MARKKIEEKPAEVKQVDTTGFSISPGFQKVKIKDRAELMKLQSENKLYAYDADTQEAVIRI